MRPEAEVLRAAMNVRPFAAKKRSAGSFFAYGNAAHLGYAACVLWRFSAVHLILFFET